MNLRLLTVALVCGGLALAPASFAGSHGKKAKSKKEMKKKEAKKENHDEEHHDEEHHD